MTYISWSSVFVISPRLFDAWVSYFQIMRQCDPNFDLKVNIYKSTWPIFHGLVILLIIFNIILMDEHQWISVTHRLTLPNICRSVTYILWSSDFASYLQIIWWRNVVLGIMDQCDSKMQSCSMAAQEKVQNYSRSLTRVSTLTNPV